MFRKLFIFAMVATAAGYCFAETRIPQVATAEVFVDTDVTEFQRMQESDVDMNREHVEYAVDNTAVVPAWPLAGSDADVVASCDGVNQNQVVADMAPADNSVKIVSKIGDDMVVENNFEFDGSGWSGGANMLHGRRVPTGFDDECESGAEMPLLHREMLEDDGAEVLGVARSGRKNCTKRNLTRDMAFVELGVSDSGADTAEFAVMQNGDAEAPKSQPDQVRSWVVASGQTLREVLQNWCDREGWDLVWTTSREYPIEASAVFKGRFTDVASALVRNFSRATPVPYAKFYKGNLVLVISTNEE